MGQTLSTPEKLLKYARTGDYAALKDLVAGMSRHEPEFVRNRARYLEVQREDGSTPLVLAAERGHYKICELLVQQGANVHHQNRKGDGGSALHEAVAHNHEAVVDLLLRSGANPLVENMKGFTAMDVACADKNVALLRRTEQAAVFRGWLMMKVPRFGGLGSEWQRRWCVICHRYPYPGAPPSRQVTHLVFLAYRSTSSTVPACRVWLDGARAAEVYNPKAIARVHADGPAQIGITLHRKHDAPAGAFYTGGSDTGYMIYLRPDDGSAQSVESLRLFLDLVNNRGARPQQQQPQQQPQQQRPGTGTPVQGGGGASPGPFGAPSTPSSATAAAGPPQLPPAGWANFQPLGQAPPVAGFQQTSVDEEYARRLQAEYDAELARRMQSNPQMPSPTGSPGNPPAPGSAAAGYPSVPGSPARPSAPGSPTRPAIPGSPNYPMVGQQGAQQAQQAQQQQGAYLGYPVLFGGSGNFGSGAIPSYQPAQQPAEAPAPLHPSVAAYPSDLSSESSGLTPMGSGHSQQAQQVQHAQQPASAASQRLTNLRPSDSSAPSAPPLIDFGTLAPSTSPPAPWWQELEPASSGAAAVPSSRPSTTGGPGIAAPAAPVAPIPTPPAHHTPAAAATAAMPFVSGHAVPQPLVPQPLPPQQPAAPAAAGQGGGQQQGEEKDESSMCVICMEDEATSGFLHGDSVHRCLCRACAAYMKESKVTMCPMCRQTATAIINVF